MDSADNGACQDFSRSPITRCKRKEEGTKKKKEEEEKAYGDYDWGVLCENSEELNRPRVSELEKYLNHHGIQHRGRKLSKRDKARLIVRHWN